MNRMQKKELGVENPRHSRGGSSDSKRQLRWIVCICHLNIWVSSEVLYIGLRNNESIVNICQQFKKENLKKIPKAVSVQA